MKVTWPIGSAAVRTTFHCLMVRLGGVTSVSLVLLSRRTKEVVLIRSPILITKILRRVGGS
jgi:hypothetical protein